MKVSEMTKIIMNAVMEYKAAKRSGNKEDIEYTLNEMENVYIMTCGCSVPGSDVLRKTILEAREGV